MRHAEHNAPPSPDAVSDEFPDHYKRYGFLLCEEIGRRIVADPALIDAARRHLDEFTKGDPRQRPSYDLWEALLKEPPAVIAERLSERSPRGDYARETAPAFGAVPVEVRTALMVEAKKTLSRPTAAAAMSR